MCWARLPAQSSEGPLRGDQGAMGSEVGAMVQAVDQEPIGQFYLLVTCWGGADLSLPSHLQREVLEAGWCKFPPGA